MGTYPTGVRVFLDGKDVTFQLFGQETIDPSDDKYVWRDMSIGDLVKVPGIHTITITCEEGIGRVDARVEIH